ncbi:hypothetical protein [Rathayibacter rathayi]|uniref:Uncharacterized protein n=1 Tax=Rathayibacter rathayi TaxID=33887 RepID=A0ABX5AB42_RATRA|nr:hypothetical protein [Rathayibacter rathayi]PPF19684.1 hypothetical protein C5C34_14945 [Rathayibacter rathayi]PPF42463.1 hypothetical protein C5C08_14985 [Rathayibacter rathayi]PPF75112.1 hypothetical protein C5C14_15015 [Rathayibacter rathayi]PPG09836.1 hypothetical protein C5C11_14995 [Rathayibacter rathayi]PPG47093.1 hypothetical protein C5C20_02365 [Rathayibacter rathayi]
MTPSRPNRAPALVTSFETVALVDPAEYTPAPMRPVVPAVENTQFPNGARGTICCCHVLARSTTYYAAVAECGGCVRMQVCIASTVT